MNYLIVSGFNFRTADIAVRERFTIPQNCLQDALAELKKKPHIKEVAILSTCNRTEIYAVVTKVKEGFQDIEDLFAKQETNRAKPNFKLMNDDVALHLLRVASGLNSLILGEGQIVAQIKAAHRAALEASATGPVLNRLFETALSCGKRVRSETDIGRLAVSMSSTAVDFGRKLIGTLEDKNVVVVGTGKMAQICLKLLASKCRTGKVVSVNRRVEDDGEETTKWDDRHKIAAEADLVIVAASSSSYVLERETLSERLSARREAKAGETPAVPELRYAGDDRDSEKTIVVIDISVPRNVDPAINDLPDVCLFHADDLGHEKPPLREQQFLIAQAESIVFDQLEEFNQWYRALSAVPTLVSLRKKAEAIVIEQLTKAEHQSEVKQLSRSITNQLLHEPTVRLKTFSRPGSVKDVSSALRMAFGIE